MRGSAIHNLQKLGRSLRMDEKKLFGRAKQKLSSSLHNSAVSLPGIEDPAGGKGSDVGGVGKLFVCQFKTSPGCGLTAKTMR